VIFASDWPVLKTEPGGARGALDLPPEVLDNYLYNNAQQFFFEEGAEWIATNCGGWTTA
jgi:predicted TIM-barrel fold metal-dependent hydrolase